MEFIVSKALSLNFCISLGFLVWFLLKVDSIRAKSWRTSHGEIKFSPRSLKALEFSDSKVFFVNPDSVRLFETVLFDDVQEVGSSFDLPTVGRLEALKHEISCLESSVDLDRCYGYYVYRDALYEDGCMDRSFGGDSRFAGL